MMTNFIKETFKECFNTKNLIENKNHNYNFFLDQNTFDDLEKVKKVGKFSSKIQALKSALKIANIVFSWKTKGYDFLIEKPNGELIRIKFED